MALGKTSKSLLALKRLEREHTPGREMGLRCEACYMAAAPGFPAPVLALAMTGAPSDLLNRLCELVRTTIAHLEMRKQMQRR